MKKLLRPSEIPLQYPEITWTPNDIGMLFKMGLIDGQYITFKKGVLIDTQTTLSLFSEFHDQTKVKATSLVLPSEFLQNYPHIEWSAQEIGYLNRTGLLLRAEKRYGKTLIEQEELLTLYFKRCSST